MAKSKFCITKKKTGGSICVNEVPIDLDATRKNKTNEAVLVREITKAMKKIKSKPIDTSKLITNSKDN